MKILDIPRSGSIAGITSSHNRAGQYVRNRVSPTQPPGTGRRATVRGNFSSVSAFWNSLTAAQQDAWTSYADSHPITDTLGQSIKLTGHQMFISCGSSLLNVGESFQSTPPTSSYVYPLGNITPAFSIASGLSIAWDGSNAADFVAAAVSRPRSSGTRFMKTFWQFSALAGDASPASLTTAAYAAQFGAPVAGQRVFYRLTGCNAEGVILPPTIGSMIVTA